MRKPARLIYEQPGTALLSRLLEGETSVGRGSPNSIDLQDPHVSRSHAVIRRTSRSDYLLIDLGSGNGTYLNGQRLLAPKSLNDGDTIGIGRSTFTFVHEAEGDPPPPLESGTDTLVDTLHKRERQKVAPTLLGRGPAMAEVFALIETAGASSLPVLVQGETGTGKELVAQAIHHAGARASRPFIAVNCAALPAAIFEAEAFGHRAGIFTDAKKDHVGFLEAASGGTLFLDEIGEMPLAVQPKLLRALQDGTVTRLGETRPRAMDVRFIAATNRDLEQESSAGRFRSDLYYRIAGLVIAIAPLRERREDILLIAERYLDVAASLHSKRCRGFTQTARDVLTAADWPGNVRELEHEIERAVAIARDGDRIDVQHLRPRRAGVPSVATAPPPSVAPAPPRLPVDPEVGRGAAVEDVDAAAGGFQEARAAFERRFIVDVLEREGWNISRTARVLGISPAAVRKKIKALGLE